MSASIEGDEEVARLDHQVAAAPTTPNNGDNDGGVEQTTANGAHASHTPSRMTINVRTPQQSTPPNDCAPSSHPAASASLDEAMDADHDTDSSGTLLSSPIQPSPKTKPESPSTTTAPGDSPVSSAHSPPVVEIEVDDDEDIEDHQDNVVEIPDDDEDDMVTENVFDSFPWAREHGREAAIAGISRALAKPLQNPSNEGELTLITKWLREVATKVKREMVSPQAAYLEEATSWECIGKMFKCILNRQVPYAESFHLDNDQVEEVALSHLWKAYSTCVAQIIDVELAYLRQTGSSFNKTSLLVSPIHMRNLANFFKCSEDVPFWILVKNILDGDIPGFSGTVLKTFVKELEKFENLVGLVKIGLSNNYLRAAASEGLRLIQNLVLASRPIPWQRLRLDPRWMASSLYLLFTELDCEIRASLKAPVELCNELVLTARELLFRLAELDHEQAREHAEEILGTTSAQNPQASKPVVLAECWFLKTLKEYILKSHMNHRIWAVETMSQRFVTLWTGNPKDQEGTRLLDLFCEFLLEIDVISYIIGIDSHPQLVSRSGNIIGFLAVNHHYGHDQTDALWSSITQNQDPRMVEALIEVLAYLANLMDLEEVVYICSKLRTLPVASFTGSFLELFRKACNCVIQKALQLHSPWFAGGEVMRQESVELLIHVAQESFPNEHSTPVTDNLHRIALQEFSNMTRPEMITAEDRHTIYATCAESIEDKTSQAAASAQIISMLLSTSPDDAPFLHELGLPEQVANELCVFVESQPPTPSEYLTHALGARLTLLFNLISINPDCLPVELQEETWEHLVGKNAISQQARDIAWHQLSQMVKSQVSANSFLSRCAADLLPKVEPEYYTPGLFDFLRQLIDYQRRISGAGEISSQGIVEPVGVELLWRVLLKAPNGTIEQTTADFLSALYLDVRTLKSYTTEHPNAILNTHTALVERCIGQLVKAYSSAKASEVKMTDVSDVEDENERHFQRTLLFMTLLIHGARRRVDLQISSPRLRKPSLPSSCEGSTGEPMEIKFQAFGGDRTEVKTVTVKNGETYSWLVDRLCEWTGFPEVLIIHCGQRINQKESNDCRLEDMGLDKGLILVKQVGEAEPTTYSTGSITTVEKEILKNYDTIYDFLDGGDDSFSHATFEFLRLLPPHGKSLALTYGGRSTENIDELASLAFQPGKTFKARISILALMKDFQTHLKAVRPKAPRPQRLETYVDDTQGPVNVHLISHSVQLLSAAILQEELIDGKLSGPHDLSLAFMTLETFNDLLKERVEPDVSSSYFQDGARLVERLVSFLQSSLRTPAHSHLTCQCYKAILEAAQHSRDVWSAFTGRSDLKDMHSTLLLSFPQEGARKDIAQTIENNCIHVAEKARFSAEEVISFYWSVLSELLPQAENCASTAREFFEITTKTFRRYDEHQRNEAALRGYISTWSDLMLGHSHEPFVGRYDADIIVLGFTQLLRTAMQSLKSFKKPLAIDDLAVNVFTKFLFPMTSEETDPGTLPVLDTATRHELYELVIALCEDSSVCRKIIDLNSRMLAMSGELPEEDIYGSSGARELRSETGYVGLDNPQALCYMNSLMTQLFMDLEFRKFIFEAEGSGEDGLLKSMKELFAKMQSSYGRSVDIRSFALCVRGTDKKPINVTIQMDTEEFFRLLMDQLESQLATSEDKQRLKNFYGGRSVNQIKSRDCQHVSETTETLFNLPLEVKGKETLEESLRAYVQGESLDGENKYKCEPCGGRLVNAVKRTCLQSVPDNLIVHLKRFDFDPFTLSRSKINDYFHFPSRVNMSPYKVEYLSDPESPIEDDWFELVGIVVHAGGVEQGHYWSYSRVRPTTEMPGRWIKFNDDTVTEQDMNKVDMECYGGSARHTSAYMLLYQRASAVAHGASDVLRAPQSLNPVAEVPAELEDEIEKDNERQIREYCMFDRAHCFFLRRLVMQLPSLNHGVCSEKHELESCVLGMALEHIYLVTGRSGDVEELGRVLDDINRVTGSYCICKKFILDWISSHKSALPDWLIYSYIVDGNNPVSTRIANFLLEMLKSIRKTYAPEYGVDVLNPELKQVYDAPKDGVLPNFLRRLFFMVYDLGWVPANGLELYQRPWDTYFTLLRAIWMLGPHERAMMLHQGFFKMAMDIATVDSNSEPTTPYAEIRKAFMSKKAKPEMFSFNHFVASMVCNVDLRPVACKSDDERFKAASASEDSSKLPLTEEEADLFYLWHPRDQCYIVLNKLLENASVPTCGPCGDIVMAITSIGNQEITNRTFSTLFEGIEVMPATSAQPFIQTVAYFVWGAPSPAWARKALAWLIKSIDQEKMVVADTYIWALNNLWSLVPKARWGEEMPSFFQGEILDLAHVWAPALLSHEDRDIQSQATKAVRNWVLGNGPCQPGTFDTPDPSGGLASKRINAVRELTRAGFERIIVLHKEAEVSRVSVEGLYLMMLDCSRFLQALRLDLPEMYGDDVETEELVRMCDISDQYVRSWPESDEYESSKYARYHRYNRGRPLLPAPSPVLDPHDEKNGYIEGVEGDEEDEMIYTSETIHDSRSGDIDNLSLLTTRATVSGDDDLDYAEEVEGV
ncbi:hypothetical protein JOL62DRAFT_556409 [Phyllosticta paracitricarpa]|uniref:USP domain-containing protein n=1 Tax=Phyllosticta paracitricarpa TaxID=2016321 RepID=A0ABR1N729_9PEZI